MKRIILIFSFLLITAHQADAASIRPMILKIKNCMQTILEKYRNNKASTIHQKPVFSSKIPTCGQNGTPCHCKELDFENILNSYKSIDITPSAFLKPKEIINSHKEFIQTIVPKEHMKNFDSVKRYLKLVELQAGIIADYKPCCNPNNRIYADKFQKDLEEINPQAIDESLRQQEE